MTNGRFAAEDRHLRTLFGVGAVGDLSDGQLLERFATLGGDPGELAFAALVERHGPMVLRVARSVLRDEPSAHDAFQATFLLLARKARSIWVRDSLGPWLHAVACRVAARQRSSEIRRRMRERDSAGPEGYRPRDPEADDLGRALHEEIDRLPERYRSAVVLCHLESLTQHEAARRLGWPVGTLQSRLARGRAKLRDRLGRRGLAPTLRAIPPIPAPTALVAATARAASTLQAGGLAAEVIAPAVLAIIDATSKGMLMTKLKLGMVALAMAGGLAVSTTGPGQERARATAGQVPAEAERPPAGRDPAPKAVGRDLAEDPSADSPSKPGSIDGDGLRPRLPAPAPGPGFPILLNFRDTSHENDRKTREVVDLLVRAGYPVKTVDLNRNKDLFARYKPGELPTFVLVDGSGKEIDRCGGEMPVKELARFYNDHRPKEPGEYLKAAAEQGFGTRSEEIAEPALTDWTNPRPWETVVRIKIHYRDDEWGFGSGAIIHSTPQESIILTCAHHFRIKDQPQVAPRDFRVPITVDLFDGHLSGRQPAMVRCTEKDLPAELIDCDFREDVGLIRIRTNKRLPASPVIPPNWPFSKGMKMYSLGCSHGQDATAWDTTILDLWVPLKLEQLGAASSAFKCSHRPKPGRSGGGLYTTEGYVAGVCSSADPGEEAGLYAPPGAIHRLLDRNGLTTLYLPGYRAPGGPPKLPAVTGTPSGPSANSSQPIPVPSRDQVPHEPPTQAPVSDQERRLADVERKLDRILDALKVDSLKDVKGDFGSPPRRKR